MKEGSSRQWRLVLLAFLFYLCLTGLGLGLVLLFGQGDRVWELARGDRPLLLQIALGVGVGLVTVIYSIVTVHYIPLARSLAVRIAGFIGPLNRPQALVLALISGLAEEFFFRLALLPTLGRLGSSILFGLLHLGPHRSFFLWAVSAATIGALFAVLVLAGWGLASVATAHILVNAINLSLLGRLARRLEETSDPPAR